MINHLRSFRFNCSGNILVVREPIIADLELVYELLEIENRLMRCLFLLGKLRIVSMIPP